MGYRAPGGTETRVSLQTNDKAQASTLARRKCMELGIVAPATVAGILMALEQEYQLQGRKSIVEMRYHAKPILRLLGEQPADRITTPVLRQYAQARKGEGKRNATINREFAALRRAMNLARQDGLIDQVPTFPTLKEDGIRQGTYTREEFEAIVGHLPTHLQGLARFGYLTGRRRGELRQIRWADVHLEEGYIVIRAATTKTGQPDRLPLFGELMALVRMLPRDGEFLFMFQGKPIGRFQETWKRAAVKAGLPDKLFHDLRRSAATDLINAGVSQKASMAVTGHKTAAVFQRYQIVKETEVRDALKRLEAYRKGESNGSN